MSEFAAVLAQPPSDWLKQFQPRVRHPVASASHQPVVEPSELTPKAREVYDNLTRDREDFERLLADLEECPISGRLFNMVVVQLPKLADDRYGIDARDPNHTLYVSRRMSFAPHVLRRDVGSSYTQQLTRFGKTLFDPFGRGPRVW